MTSEDTTAEDERILGPIPDAMRALKPLWRRSQPGWQATSEEHGVFERPLVFEQRPVGERELDAKNWRRARQPVNAKPSCARDSVSRLVMRFSGRGRRGGDRRRTARKPS